jgi:cytochrome b involved in lipid metabolism
MSVHPGGKTVLMNYLYRDIKDILFNVYPHKEATTLSILFRKEVGKVEEEVMGRYFYEKNKANIKPKISKLKMNVSF